MTRHFQGLPWWLSSEESAWNAEHPGSIPGSEDPLEKGMATPPVFLPGESHGQRNLPVCSPLGYKELDTTEQLITHLDTFSKSNRGHVTSIDRSKSNIDHRYETKGETSQFLHILSSSLWLCQP